MFLAYEKSKYQTQKSTLESEKMLIKTEDYSKNLTTVFHSTRLLSIKFEAILILINNNEVNEE